MFISIFTRLLIATALAGFGYATAAELPDAVNAPLTPPVGQFSVIAPANGAHELAAAGEAVTAYREKGAVDGASAVTASAPVNSGSAFPAKVNATGVVSANSDAAAATHSNAALAASPMGSVPAVTNSDTALTASPPQTAPLAADSDAVLNESAAPAADAGVNQSAPAQTAEETIQPQPQQGAAGSTPAEASGSATAAQTDGEEVKQDRVITLVLQAIRAHQLTSLSSECLGMSFVDDSDDPANYLIDVRENRNYPACGGDPETAPHLFFFKAGKKDGALQTDAGVEPDDFYPLEDSAQPAVAALTAADFVIQVNSTSLALGQPWNEDVMMSLPPERAQATQNQAQDADAPYRYYQHRYDVLALTVSNEGWDRQQRSADDSYLGQITLLDATLETHRGARVGMTVAELEQKYGPGEADERNGESWLSWQQDDKVIAARIGNGLVTQITLSQLQHAADAQG